MRATATWGAMGFGLPRDPGQWLAAALAVVASLAAHFLARADRRRGAFLLITGGAALLLSLAYVAVYLRGAPRIIDATSYWQEARALAAGRLSWPLAEPAASTMGRFLLRVATPEGTRAAVIFPPGYPAVLALGFLAGAPMVVGPVLAALLSWVTYDIGARLGRAMELDLRVPHEAASAVGPIAASLSVVCGALRYHTADTMSHGLAATCVATALACSFRAQDHIGGAQGVRAACAWAGGAGLAAGWLGATRPVTALALVATLAVLVCMDRRRTRPGYWKVLVIGALAALPAAALLAAHRIAATGHLLVSPQALYYQTSDGPPGCFRYGFGAGVGCFVEHGDFVRARLAEGFGAAEAIGTTLRRLQQHLVDPANIEPLALLVPLGAALAWRSREVRAVAAAILFQVLAYVPFYFDGNYPGGGARFYADILPLEHALLAVGAVALATRRSWAPRRAALVVALALAGFAVRAGFDHAHLRDREGGRPMFEPSRVAAAGVAHGLVFVDTDHGHGLGAVPGGGAQTSIDVVRWRGDGLDWMAWDARRRPPAHRYVFAWGEGQAATVAVEPLAFPDAPPSSNGLLALDEDARRIEGESLWPPIAQVGGWALSQHASGTCASAGRWLALLGSPGAAITVALPTPWLRGRGVRARLAMAGEARVRVELLSDGAVVGTTEASAREARLSCVVADQLAAPREAVSLGLRLEVLPGAGGADALLALDRVDVLDQ